MEIKAAKKMFGLAVAWAVASVAAAPAVGVLQPVESSADGKKHPAVVACQAKPEGAPCGFLGSSGASRSGICALLASAGHNNGARVMVCKLTPLDKPAGPAPENQADPIATK